MGQRWFECISAAAVFGVLMAVTGAGASEPNRIVETSRDLLRPYSFRPARTSIGLDGVGYFRASDDASLGFRDSFMPQLVGELGGQVEGGLFAARAQADLRLMVAGIDRDGAWESTYIEVPEAYAGTSAGGLGPIQLIVGRKLESWNHLDEQWRLGIWQPRFRWDYMRPESVGLTGAYLRLEQPLWRVVAWASPIFVPERGVQLKTEGGELDSGSRWFVPPPRTVRLFDQDTPVRYSLITPPMTELIAHPGASVMARVGRADGAWGSAGAAIKPVNQLLLASSGKLKLSPRGEAIYGDAKIYPRVIYHQLASVEGGYESEALTAWASLLGERPLRDATPADWTTQEVGPALSISSVLDVRVMGSKDRATRLNVGWISQWGGNAGDQGPDAVGSGQSRFEARYPHSTALSLGLRTGFVERVAAVAGVLYDIGHRGAIWSMELKYRALGAWELGVGADLLSSLSAGDPEGADWINRFNANDRVHAGVTYVF